MKKLQSKELISTLFQARNNVHFTHLIAEYNSHLILGGLYESLNGLIDRISELQLGHYGFIDKLSPAAVEVLDVEDLEAYQTIFENQAKLEEKEDLKNALAELQEAFSKSIYLISLLANGLTTK